MLGYILSAIMIIVLICVASYFYIDWQVNKEIEQKHKEYDAVENRLTTSLKTLCAQLGIDLSYHKELGDAAGRILYHSMNGRSEEHTSELQSPS